MEDITPKLQQKIQKDFQKKFDSSRKIKKLRTRIENGNATYKEAHEFAIEIGEILESVFQSNLSSSILPDGRMYYNIADRVVRPMLENNYELTVEISAEIQRMLNEKAGIGIKAIKPKMNQDKVQGFVDIVSGKEKYDDISYMLGEPVINFTQSVVDDVVKANADFQYKSGLSPKIRRTSTGKCCEWCNKLVGVYDYEDVSNTGNNVFRRHKHCKCIVEYDPGNGKRQNVHSKIWSKPDESDKIRARQIVGAKEILHETPKEKEKRIAEENRLSLADRIARHPKTLAAYTPKGLKESLENAGYEVKELGRGNFKGVPFEEGGGFRVNFGGDGIIQYHPEKRSHHDGAYYKISTGEGGKRRYDTKGNEIK